MSLEGQLLDRKSLRAVTGKTADWGELAKDCVAFANAVGGRLLIGIEDGEELPPPGQQIPDTLPDLLRRRLGERTVNVSVQPEIRHADNAQAAGARKLPLPVRGAMRLASKLMNTVAYRV